MNQITSYDIKLFTQGLKQSLGIDFTEYSNAFLRYRIEKFLKKWSISSLEVLLIKLQKNSMLLERFLLFMSVETTEMFRDPGFWRVFNKLLLDKYAKAENIRFLVPFVTSDDELFTLLMILDQSGLLSKSTIIATTPFSVNIKRIKSCEYSERKLSIANENYRRYIQKSGSIDEYFTKQGNMLLFRCDLVERVEFIESDILSNNFSKGENFDVILFRNRMIYFNLNLQNKVLEQLFYYLSTKGYLIIGFKESIKDFVFIEHLRQIDKQEKIFKKIK